MNDSTLGNHSERTTDRLRRSNVVALGDGRGNLGYPPGRTSSQANTQSTATTQITTPAERQQET